MAGDEGSSILDGMLATADVLVENFRPGTMDSMGYGWERCHRLWPKLIVCSVSGFGQTGPLATAPAMDIVVQANVVAGTNSAYVCNVVERWCI